MDELLGEAGLAVAEVEAPLAEEGVVVPQRLDRRLLRQPPFVPLLERRGVVQADVLDVVARQPRPLRRL